MKKIILLIIITTTGCEKDEDIKPEPKIDFNEWANFGNTTFQVDTNLIFNDSL